MRRRVYLGQHYLVDRSAIERIIDLSGIEQGERVLEVGTGKGALTERLCGISTHVEAFEIDEENFLTTKRLGIKNLTLHLGDAFAEKPAFDVLVSSLPYSESSNFVEWLALSEYDRAVVVLQKDFADKLVAPPGDEKYRAISVISQIAATTRVVQVLDTRAFDPPPKVLSAIVEMRWRTRLSERQIALVRLLFSQKRRKLSTALKNLHLELRASYPDLARRVSNLSPSDVEAVLARL